MLYSLKDKDEIVHNFENFLNSMTMIPPGKVRFFIWYPWNPENPNGFRGTKTPFWISLQNLLILMNPWIIFRLTPPKFSVLKHMKRW